MDNAQESPRVFFSRDYSEKSRNTSSVQEALFSASLEVADEGKGRLANAMTRVFIPGRL